MCKCQVLDGGGEILPTETGFFTRRQQKEFLNVGEAASYGLGSGIGWWLAILMMAAIREKITYSNVPAPLRGPGIAFIITGLMGNTFMSFLGIQIN